jgi:hypothetical protein
MTRSSGGQRRTTPDSEAQASLATIPFPDAPIFVKYIIGILLGVAVVWTYAAFARAAWTKWSRWHHDKLLKEAQHSADTAGAAEGQEAEHS